MRLAGSESQAPENPGHVQCVILLQAVLRQRVVVDQPLQTEHPDDVGLGLLQSGKCRPDGLTDIDLLAVLAGERRPSPWQTAYLVRDPKHRSLGERGDV